MSRGGLVERTVTPTRPPGVSYPLTDSGAQLVPILRQLGGWAEVALPPERCRNHARAAGAAVTDPRTDAPAQTTAVMPPSTKIVWPLT